MTVKAEGVMDLIGREFACTLQCEEDCHVVEGDWFEGPEARNHAEAIVTHKSGRGSYNVVYTAQSPCNACSGNALQQGPDLVVCWGMRYKWHPRNYVAGPEFDRDYDEIGPIHYQRNRRWYQTRRRFERPGQIIEYAKKLKRHIG
eukprot:GFYU01000567.1.p1 GENE.GFYU01000567.1~~GFYU01000567.1.p1  ORF type:complete len:145 (+),score=9.77 GFYU01000567.1:517-951(+)